MSATLKSLSRIGLHPILWIIVIIHETVGLAALALHVQEPDVALGTEARGCARTRNSFGDPGPARAKPLSNAKQFAN